MSVFAIFSYSTRLFTMYIAYGNINCICILHEYINIYYLYTLETSMRQQKFMPSAKYPSNLTYMSNTQKVYKSEFIVIKNKFSNFKFLFLYTHYKYLKSVTIV